MAKIVVLIPCFNEGQSIARVVEDFKLELPHADIYVYDNNSTDETTDEAARAGAIVRKEKRQGKGNVVRSMFDQVDADIYVIVDGDGTYPASKVHELIRPIASGEADMVSGSRLHPLSESSFRYVNLIGNKIFLYLLNAMFKVRLTDLLSGYRAFSRQFVKGIPVLSRGFAIETELTLKAVEKNYRIVEVPVDLTPRPEGSYSKIRVFSDGLLILGTIFAMLRDYKPLSAFGILGLFLILLGFMPGVVVIREYLATGYIARIPSVILAVGLVLSGVLTAFTGVVLHTMARRFQELDCQVEKLNKALNDRHFNDR
jgi:glycosyltransferase involved in cell wall biosynthesis